MTPDLIALSRRFCALPDAPRPDGPGPLYSTVGDDHTRRRDYKGALWLDAAGDESDDYEWVLDLTDAATGGVLLSLYWTIIDMIRADAVGAQVYVTAWGSYSVSGATLAEAIVRAVLRA